VSALRKKINAIDAKITQDQVSFLENSLLLKGKMKSTKFIVPVLLGSVGVGYLLMRHPNPAVMKARLAAAPGFLMRMLKHVELILPFIL
jgi:hypothetical protein